MAEEEQETKESTAVSEQQGTKEEQDAYSWLQKYGYAVADPAAGTTSFGERLSEALQLYQEIQGLPADGTLNEATRALMAQPRCSHPDTNLVLKKRGGPAARYVINSRWPTNYITYSHANFTSDLPQATVEHALEDAGYRWSLANPALTIVRLSPPAGYISVGFHTGSHGDGLSFDGPGGTLAHTFDPGHASYPGKMHFDDDETWSNGSSNTDPSIYAVALHEMGHALGLGHTTVAGSVMVAGYIKTPYFSNDDVEAIRRNYQPDAPVSMTTESEHCGGWNEVRWPAQPGATQYSVIKSTTSTFTNPEVYATVYSPSILVEVPVNKTWYFKVHACNEYGCGPLSNAQTSASYYNGPCD